jgi:hypothetical protein
MRAQWLHVWNIAFVVKRQPMHAPKGFPAKWGEQENELVLSKSRDGLDAVQRLKKVLFEPPPQQAEAAMQCVDFRLVSMSMVGRAALLPGVVGEEDADD